MTMLLIAGIGVLAAGLLAIAIGIPVKEFSFGNNLILSGVIAACTGVLLLALAVVVRELRNIARRLGPANLAAVRAKNEPQLSPASVDQPVPATQSGVSPPPPEARPDEVAARADAPGAAAVEPVAKPRRNLLFSSSRRERDATAQEAAADSSAAPVAAPKEPPAASFEDAWPQSDRGRTDVLRRAKSPAPSAEPNLSATPAQPPAAAPPTRNDEPAPVTVLKSGVVDGMAYSLYSDGSIEAQMPEGMMRFASIDELRSHLDQRP
jgi:hypothetical protein